MFGVVREFQAPLGVTHAVRGRFGPTSNTLGVVFARKNSLDIYIVRANPETARLELLQSTPLGANVISMAVLRRGNTPADFLCVGFDRMRVAIMAWDHDARNWTTEQALDLGSLLGSKLCSPSTILRSLDPEDYGRPLLRGIVGDYGEPLIRADPSGRCVAVLAKKQNAVYVVPVHVEDDPSRPGAKIVNPSDVFLIDLPNDYEAANVKDFAFLHDSFEPNILILHEPKRTWSGRAAIQRNTCHLLNLSVDVRSKRHSKTWVMDQLPYDSDRIEAVPESAGGGALLVSTSVLMQVRHGACVAGLSLNCFGDAYAAEMKSNYDTITASDTLVECDAAHCRFLDFEERLPLSSSGMQCIALLSLKGGELYFLNVAVGSRNAIAMKRAGSTVIASEIVPINERFFVLASRLSDSLLVEYQKTLEDTENNDQAKKENDRLDSKGNLSDTKSKPSKRKKRKRTAEEEAEYEMIYGVKPPQESSDEDSEDESGRKQSALELEEKDEGTRGVYDDEDELGWVFNSGPENDATTSKGSGSGSWALKVKDTITCFGPGADLTVGASPDDVTNTKLDMVIAGGYAKNGCLAVVHQSIRPTIRTEIEVPGCEGVWTLLDPSVARSEKLEREERNAAATRRNAARRARNTKKHAARKRYVHEAMNQLRREREDQNEAEKKTSKVLGNDDTEERTVNEKDAQPDVIATNTAEPPGNGPQGVPATNVPDMKSLSNGSVRQEDNEERISPPTKRVKTENGDLSHDVSNGDDAHSTLDIIGSEVIVQLQQQAEAEFPLESEEALEENISEEGALHSYMLLSTATTTTALKTGVDIVELIGDAADFTTHERTIAAGNVLGTHAIVQVVPSGVKVLQDGKCQCEYLMPQSQGLIQRAQVSDPLVLLQKDDGCVMVLVVKAEVFNSDETTALGEPTSIPGQEDLFDEYGMSFVRNESAKLQSGNGIAVENKSGSLAKTTNEGQNGKPSYRNFSFSVEFSTPEVRDNNDSISAAFLYKGPLAGELDSDGILQPGAEKASAPEETSSVRSEEDLMLYGAGDDEDESASNMHAMTVNADDALGSTVADEASAKNGSDLKHRTPRPKEKGVVLLPQPAQNEENEHHLLVMSKSSGTLQIVSPALRWETVLECPSFFTAPPLVKDDPVSDIQYQNGHFPFASPDFRVRDLAMIELSSSALLAGLSTPILVAVSATGVPLIYRAFLSSKSVSTAAARSRLSFHRIVSRDRTTTLLARSIRCAHQQSDKAPGEKDFDQGTRIPLVHFHNIAGRGGLFVGGLCPLFLFAERGYPRVHPLSHMNTSGAPVSKDEYDSGCNVVAFTEFHNVKCPRGFVSVGRDGLVRIGELPPPSIMNYDAPTPIRKIALRCTPHKVAYHAGSATYGVLASMPTLTTREERLARILQSLEKHDKRHYQHTAAQAEAETGDDRANRVPPLFEELHELRIYRPDTWELIKSHKLQKGEVGLAIANMKVDVYKQKTVASGAEIPSSRKGDDGNESAFAASLKLRPKDMLVIGTGYLNGEDASSRGRLLMFEISRQEVYTESGGVFTAFQLQLIAEKELFSPVTAVASMEGYVIAGIGPQVSVYKLVGDEIVHLSFAFGQLYCTSIASIKQYVVAADMCKSVSFMYFRDRNNSVNFLGKDYEHVTSYATEFLIENENMSIIVSDGKGNLQLMNYAHASVPESRGGKRLLINGGTHFGSRINKFVRVRGPDSKTDLQSGRAGSKAGRHALLFTTLDGGIGALVSVTEVEFRKLGQLREQAVKSSGVVRHAGVNPDEQTAFRPETSSTVLLEQRLLDSRALFDIFAVSLIEMRIIARKAETDLKGMAQTVMNLDDVLSRF